MTNILRHYPRPASPTEAAPSQRRRGPWGWWVGPERAPSTGHLAAPVLRGPSPEAGISQLSFYSEKCPEAFATLCPYLVPPAPATEAGTPSSSTDPNPRPSAGAQHQSRPGSAQASLAGRRRYRSTRPPSLVRLYIEPLLCAWHRPAPSSRPSRVKASSG